jgi:hypothetical protein
MSVSDSDLLDIKKTGQYAQFLHSKVIKMIVDGSLGILAVAILFFSFLLVLVLELVLHLVPDPEMVKDLDPD